ncbi:MULTISPECIES: helix-turn-helix domain-containing protein [unclassified Oceanispirochaeta]|uniref:helix-turn-helix domain-containing protein n=1 Tax=unclassified Oceanispirochaeta TaxID=2635722 RepID=UPI0013146F71|nr:MULTISPECIES: helix-turn-helix domain-containing protein [unclassified Oceanispirochaeta]MBF9016800.1 helix-turn-helix domain-containing protein [Oceanispirochaeta sp. M2]NPD72070.1 helix-turn-helix domain-containing protein [Oceanispirochaeta sp. M1]
MKKEKSFFLSILGLFLILSLFIIILATSLFINRTRIVVRNAFAERNLTSTSQVSHMFDVLHAQMIPGLKEASYNNHLVSSLMYSNDLTKSEMLDGIEYLDGLLLTYPLIHSLYLYNGQMDIFLTTSTGYEAAENFYDREVLNLLEHFDHTYIDRYWPRQGTTQYSQYRTESQFDTLTLLMGTTPNNNAPIKGALISNIDVVALEKIINTEFDHPDNSIFIYNQEDALIARTGIMDNEEMQAVFSRILESDSEGRGSFLVENNHLVSYQFNYRLGWYIISVMPLDDLDNSILDVSKRILYIMIILLLFSFALSYLASRRVYKPIISLVNYVSDDSSGHSVLPVKNNSREISFITGRYKDMLDEKESLEESLEELQDDYRIEIFRAILDGHKYHFWEEELVEGDVKLLRKPLSLFVLQIDDYYRLIQDMDRNLFRTKRRSMVSLIQSGLNDENEVLIDKSSRNLVCLLSGLPDKHLKRMLELQKHIQMNTDLTVSIGYSFRSSIEDNWLHTLYDHSLSAANGKFALGFNQFNEYLDQDKSTVMFPGDVADKLLSCLRQGNLSGAEAKLEMIRKNLTQATYQDFEQHIRIFSYRILRFLKGMNMPELQKLLQQVRSHPETLETLANFQIFFLDILKTLSEQTGKAGRKGVVHFREIEDSLLLHYKDPACCVQYLADDMKMSINYIRQIYKDFSDNSLSDEINHLRVEEAARLLVETDDVIKDLYSRAGFSNYNSFFSSFKKIKGITPAVYRRNYENEQ